MMFGLGDTTSTTTPVTTTPGLTDGLKLWMSPSAAFSALGAVASNPSTAFSSALMPFTLGILLPPIALVAILMGSSGGGKKH